MGWSGLKFNIGQKEALNDFQNFVDIGFRLILSIGEKDMQQSLQLQHYNMDLIP